MLQLTRPVKHIRALIAVTAALAAGLLTFTLTSVAGAQDATVPPIDGVAGLEVAASNNILAEVRALESIGDTVWAGGLFLEVVDRSAGTRIAHPYLAAFDANTGEYLPYLLTTPDGPVYDIRDLGDGRMLIAGEFTTVNGIPNTAGLAIIDTETGKVDQSFQAAIGGSSDPSVNSIDIDNGWIYAVGSFTRISGGGDPSFVPMAGATRVSLATGAVDTSWTPVLDGGGWGVAVGGGERVHIGGYFSSANGTADTEALATFDTLTGELVPGWNHGLPWELRLAWNSIGGAVNDLEVSGDLLYVAGAKHSYAVMQSSTGESVRIGPTTNDAQTVEVQNGRVYIGCHCSGSLTWTQVLDADTGTEISTDGAAHLRGAAGTWATTVDEYGCVWHGGNFLSQVVDGVRTAVYSMARTCDTPPPVQTRTAPQLSDEPEPGQPGRPSVVSQHGSTVTIGWTAPANAQDLRYQILRNGVPVGVAGSTTFADVFVPAGTHDWQVQAIALDTDAGPISERSSAALLPAAQNAASAGSAYGPGGVAIPTAIDGSEAANGAESFVEIDLGRQVAIDKLEILGTGLSRARVIIASDPILSEVLVEAQDEPHRTLRLIAAPEFNTTLPIASTARWIRIQRAGNSTVRIAEIRVLTTEAISAASDRSIDITAPVAPKWAAKSAFSSGSLYRWGGASDDVAVAYYELYRGDQYLGRRTTATMVGLDATLPTAVSGVVAFDADGNSSPNLPDGPLAPPQSCSSVLDGDAVTLDVDGVPDGASVIVYRSRNGGSWSWAARLNGNGPHSWSNTNVVVGSTYEYRVVSAGDQGLSEPTSCGPAIEVESSQAAPLIPTTCSAAVVDGAIVVSWTRDANDTSDAIIVYRSRNGGPWYWTGRVGSTIDSFTNTSVAPGNTYAYRVVAQSQLGNSEPRTCGAAIEPVAPELAGPVDCVVDTVGAVNLGFNPSPVEAADYFIVQRSRAGGPWWWAARLNSPTTNWTDSRAASGTTYEYRVIARAGSRESVPVECGGPVIAP